MSTVKKNHARAP
jgi:hypothetical protein